MINSHISHYIADAPIVIQGKYTNKYDA
jgi:hypothetical protein